MNNNKYIGILFGLMFFVLGSITYFINGNLIRPNVLGVFVVGVLYLITSFHGTKFKIAQIAVTILMGCFGLLSNDVNSFISIFILSTAFHMYKAYFPKNHNGLYLLPIPYLLTALVSGWGMYEILQSAVIYVGYTTAIYIMYKKEIGGKTDED